MSTPAADTPFPRVTIDGRPIPRDAFVFELGRLVKLYSRFLPPGQLQAQMPDLRAKAVDQAIGAALLMSEAAASGIAVTDAEIDERLRALRREAGGAAKLRATLRRQGTDEAALRERIRLGRRADKLVAAIVGNVPEPSEEEMRAHFEQHRREFRVPERIRVQHVLVRPATDDAPGHAAARGRLAAIRDRLAAGAPFADEAAAHSACPSGRKAGGSLGWVSRGMLVKEIDEAAFSLAVGGLSDVVRSPLGYHLVHKTGHEPASEPSYEDARERVREFLRHAARGAALQAHLAERRARAKIEILPPEPV